MFSSRIAVGMGCPSQWPWPCWGSLHHLILLFLPGTFSPSPAIPCYAGIEGWGREGRGQTAKVAPSTSALPSVDTGRQGPLYHGLSHGGPWVIPGRKFLKSSPGLDIPEMQCSLFQFCLYSGPSSLLSITRHASFLST